MIRLVSERASMLSLGFILWLQPTLFMIHDFEEIIMSGPWSRKYRTEIDRAWPRHKPFGLGSIRHDAVPTLATGVAIEFVFFTLICVVSAVLGWYSLWLAMFLGITLHFVLIHVPLCIRFGHYVPGVVTSVLLLVPSVWAIVTAVGLLHYGYLEIGWAVVAGIATVAVMLPLLHRAMAPISELIHGYAPVPQPGQSDTTASAVPD
ncbi:HXXEE domain-containing protein [Raineyella sp. W15-4]|uniref:HXXEE domain-containing protein n=1 Tax=Raineyella sp. W15-4 TaxID=3081651 RepID=UPI0039890854